MSGRCDGDLLEALALGELGDERAAQVEAHASSCRSCEAELAWLRLELSAFEQRAIGERAGEGERGALWESIQARIEDDGAQAPAPRVGRGRPLLHFGAGFAAATVAAAALILWLQLAGSGGPDAPAPAPSVAGQPAATGTSDQTLAAAHRALEKAESEYAEAIAALEATYKARRERLHPATARGYDKAMADSRAALDGARRAAGDDVNARLQVIDAYSNYLHTLQTVVTESDL